MNAVSRSISNILLCPSCCLISSESNVFFFIFAISLFHICERQLYFWSRRRAEPRAFKNWKLEIVTRVNVDGQSVAVNACASLTRFTHGSGKKYSLYKHLALLSALALDEPSGRLKIEYKRFMQTMANKDAIVPNVGAFIVRRPTVSFQCES